MNTEIKKIIHNEGTINEFTEITANISLSMGDLVSLCKILDESTDPWAKLLLMEINANL